MTTKKILFVCLGNICRSPMAEAIFQDLIKKHNLQPYVQIDSAGIDSYHQGEMADIRMRECAKQNGYNITHRSRPITTNDFETFDLIIGMDQQNIDALHNRALNKEQKRKIGRMTNYCIENIEADAIPDPYYGEHGQFQYVVDLLKDAAQGLLLKIKSECKEA